MVYAVVMNGWLTAQTTMNAVLACMLIIIGAIGGVATMAAADNFFRRTGSTWFKWGVVLGGPVVTAAIVGVVWWGVSPKMAAAAGVLMMMGWGSTLLAAIFFYPVFWWYSKVSTRG